MHAFTAGAALARALLLATIALPEHQRLPLM